MKGFADLKNFPFYILSCLFANLINLIFPDLKSNITAIVVFTLYIMLIEWFKERDKFKP